MNPGSAYEMILSRMAETKDEVLAEELDCDRSQISRIRSSDRGIRLNEIDRLLKALGLSVVCNAGDIVTMPAERARAVELLAMEALMKGGR